MISILYHWMLWSLVNYGAIFDYMWIHLIKIHSLLLCKPFCNKSSFISRKFNTNHPLFEFKNLFALHQLLIWRFLDLSPSIVFLQWSYFFFHYSYTYWLITIIHGQPVAFKLFTNYFINNNQCIGYQVSKAIPLRHSDDFFFFLFHVS